MSPVHQLKDKRSKTMSQTCWWCSDVSWGVTQSACIVLSNDRAGRGDLQVLLLYRLLPHLRDSHNWFTLFETCDFYTFLVWLRPDNRVVTIRIVLLVNCVNKYIVTESQCCYLKCQSGPHEFLVASELKIFDSMQSESA